MLNPIRAASINSTQSFGGLICFHVALISVPFVVDILRIMSLILTFLKRILTVLLDKEVVSIKVPESGQ